MNLSWLPASNILLSISRASDGFDTALGECFCVLQYNLLCILMIHSMQKVQVYLSQIYSTFFVPVGYTGFCLFWEG